MALARRQGGRGRNANALQDMTRPPAVVSGGLVPAIRPWFPGCRRDRCHGCRTTSRDSFQNSGDADAIFYAQPRLAFDLFLEKGMIERAAHFLDAAEQLSQDVALLLVAWLEALSTTVITVSHNVSSARSCGVPLTIKSRRSAPKPTSMLVPSGLAMFPISTPSL